MDRSLLRASVRLLALALLATSAGLVAGSPPLWARPAARSSEAMFAQVWNVSDPAASRQTRAKMAYNPFADQVFVVWEDGRNDPRGYVDTYGFDYNTDLYGRVYNSAGAAGSEIAIATDGAYEDTGRYDNEQWPAVTFDPWARRQRVAYMTIPAAVLAAGEMQTTTCYDLDERTLALPGVTTDLAWYTPPPTLTSPFGGGWYDWSCQHEPEAIARGRGYDADGVAGQPRAL